MEIIEKLVALIDGLAPAFIGLIGVIIGAGLTSWHDRAARRHGFIERQITELYAPLASIRMQIRTKNEIAARISKAADAAWKIEVERHDAADLTKVHEEKYQKLIDYDNRQFKEEVFPDYQEMLKVFTVNLWLAEKSTKAHYSAFFEFVEQWKRWLAGSIPSDVLQIVDRREETLLPFYDDLEKQLNNLRSRIASGKA